MLATETSTGNSTVLPTATVTGDRSAPGLLIVAWPFTIRAVLATGSIDNRYYPTSWMENFFLRQVLVYALLRGPSRIFTRLMRLLGQNQWLHQQRLGLAKTQIFSGSKAGSVSSSGSDAALGGNSVTWQFSEQRTLLAVTGLENC